MADKSSPEGTEITQELLDRLKARDRRFVDIDTALKLDQELRDSTALNILLGAIGIELEDARDALEIVNPTDFDAIKNLQARAYRARFTARTFETIRRQGRQSAQEIEAEGMIDVRDHSDNEPSER